MADIDELWEIADAVHANGGKVIGTIDITSPWILTNLEPYCDALLGGFGTSTQALIDVITGEYSPTGKLPVTMVSCYEVIAVNEVTLEDGNTYDICVSPNDVPGYDKEREKVIANTRALLAGMPANNVLLYGDAGTGKSSAVKAIANEFAPEGLRLVEVKKNQLYQIPDLMDKLAANPLKFILFIDDLSFTANLSLIHI